MSRRLTIILGTIAPLALFTTTAMSEPPALADGLSADALAKEMTVRGRLQRTVEPGGGLIAKRNQKYLILNARNFQHEQWFADGNEVEAAGETKPDLMTTYMEGTPFEAASMRALSAGSSASQTDSRTLTKVLVTGDAIVQAQPDTAIITVSVVTQGRNALAAQQENARKSDAVISALKSAAGTGAEIKTSGYSLQPIRVYKEGQPPTITGYEARNSVTVTLPDLTKVGPVIDATGLAGANDIAGISFTLRKDRPARDQALADATREALSKAQVLATALGGRVVRIVEVQEGGVDRPRPMYIDQAQVMKAQSTPIEVGTLEISSRVQLVAEVEVAAR